MPTYEPDDVVTPRSAPGGAPWAAEVDSVSAVERVEIRDDGTYRRGVLVSWTVLEPPLALRGFRVLFREEDTDEWVSAGDAGADAGSLMILDRFRLLARYEFVVVPLGPACCAARPPQSCSVRARLRVLGEVVVPAAPTGLRLVQSVDRSVLRWDPVVSPGTPVYEVRFGPEAFDLAEIVGRTTLTELAVSDLPPLGHVAGAPAVTFHVAVRLASGERGSAARLTGETIQWGAAADVGPAFPSAPSWPGTRSGAVVTGGELLLDAGETTATYLTGTRDAGSLREWRVFVLTLARRENMALTPNLAQFSPNSWWGQRRTASGGDEEAYPQDPVPRRGPMSPADAFDTPNAMTSYTPNSFADPRPDDSPVLTPNEARFTPNSAAGRSATANGGIASTAGTGYAVEVRFSSDASAWTDWLPYAPQTRTFRYVQVRLTMTQPAPAMQLTVEDLAVYFVRTTPKALTDVVADLAAFVAATGTWSENETPAGTIDGSRVVFTLAHDPIGPVQLFKGVGAGGGVLMRLGTDYGISGDEITYAVPPAAGDWHRVWYRY